MHTSSYSPRLCCSEAALHSARSLRRAGRSRLACSASADGPLGGVGMAIDLRSRLQQAELARISSGSPGGWQEMGGAWVRCPPGRAWGVVHFAGGAVLGSYPALCYDALLSSLCDSASLIVVATPFDLAADHDAVAAAVSTKLRAALSAVCARDGYSPVAMPLFGLGHSLGAKLQTLLASGGDLRYAAQVFVAFNNASATDSVRLLEKFARALLAERGSSGGGANAAMFDTLLRAMPAVGAAAERAAAAAGLEFTPAPAETLSRVRECFATPRALLVRFENDELDQNTELLFAMQKRSEGSVSPRVTAVRRAGNHLTPVTISLSPENSPLGARLGKSVGSLKAGDEEAARQLGRDIGAWLAERA